MRTPRLTAAVLLLLAACQVDTDSLKAKTSDECFAQGLKACGYKCVSPADPATGCDDASCQPCPSGPAGEAALCDGTRSCSWVGAGTCGSLTECGPDCVDVRSDDLHCGACDHACSIGASCSSGVCGPALVTQGDPTASPRALTCREYGWLFFLDPASYAWIDADVMTPAIDPLPSFAGPYGAGARLVATDEALPYLYLGGRDAGAGAVYEYDSYLGSNVILESGGAEAFTGIAASDLWVYSTKPAETRLRWVERFGAGGFGNDDYLGFDSDVLPLEGVATIWDSTIPAWRVFALAGRSIVTLEEVSGVPTFRNLWRLPFFADRLALAPIPGGVVAYVASSATGELWAFPEDSSAFQIAPAGNDPGHLDLVADWNGAYWTNLSERLVMEYRAYDGAVFPLATSRTTTAPWGLCLGPWSGYVSWSDAGPGANDVRGVLK